MPTPRRRSSGDVGGSSAEDSDVIVALVAYSYWLAQNALIGGTTMPGRGYPRLCAHVERLLTPPATQKNPVGSIWPKDDDGETDA